MARTKTTKAWIGSGAKVPRCRVPKRQVRITGKKVLYLPLASSAKESSSDSSSESSSERNCGSDSSSESSSDVQMLALEEVPNDISGLIILEEKEKAIKESSYKVNFFF